MTAERHQSKSAGGLSRARLARLHERMAGYADRGDIPGIVTLVSRRGEVHVDAVGRRVLGGDEPMRRDTIFRIASMTKPVVAAAALMLVEDCVIRLDEPIDRFIPELANRRVLKRLDSPLDDTVPAKRPITVRDLLTFRMGFGSVMAPPGTYPIQHAIRDLGIGGDGWPMPSKAAPTDEWVRRLASLPLIHQPGERWMYNTGSDVLGVLIARAAGASLGAFLRERIFDPLAMKDTGFYVPADGIDRLAGCYQWNPLAKRLEVYDAVRHSGWGSPPPFESGAGGLVSTAHDYLAFCQTLLDTGRHRRGRILSRPSVELMMSDQVTAEQRVGSELFFGSNSSWGFGGAVTIRRDDLSAVPGRYGWTGGLGTAGYTDPAEQLVGILLTQRLMDSPQAPPVFEDFWASAYAAIDD